MKNLLKKSLLIFLISFSFTLNCDAQPGEKILNSEGVITYSYKSNGIIAEGIPEMKLFFKDNIAHLSNNSSKNKSVFINYDEQNTYQILNTKGGELITLKTPFSDYEKAEITKDTATILGYLCRKAKVNIRSNNIEIWFTNDIKIKGSPSLMIAPGLGLILKTVRNGNFETFATSVDIRKVKKSEMNLPKNFGQIVDEATYNRKEIDNRFLSIPIFSKQQINFTDSIVNPAKDLDNKLYRYASGTVVIKKIHIPEGYEHAFINLTQYSNGDAYDRTGSVFLIPTSKEISFLNGLKDGVDALPLYISKSKKYQGVVETNNYLPPLELMRFFTPFGVRAFNDRSKISGYNWADSVNYKQDVSDLMSMLKGDVWIGVYIGNYDKGGHIINLNLDLYPTQADSGKLHDWIEPIFNTVNIMEMAGQNYGTMFDKDSLTVTVNIPEGLKNIYLRYISTGHGGWENGDEFNKKKNEIFIDGKKVFDFIPWRTDCATYRMYNPSSGNFGDGLSSSDLSRSNWCPGTTTNPVYIPLNISPGKHTFKVAIPLGKTEGNSFSSWNISGCLVGEFN